MIRRRPLAALPSAWSAAVAGAVLVATLAGALALAPRAADEVPMAPAPLADRLGPQTWAFAIPHAWIAAPLGGLAEGDILDLLGTRPSERATAAEVARGLRVMSIDDAALVVECTAEDAAAIVEARARGHSLMPILRSTR